MFLWMLRCGVILFAAAGVLISVGAHGGRWIDRLDLLTHGALIWLGWGLSAVLAALVLLRRKWRILAVGLGVTTIVATGLLMLPEFLRPRTAPVRHADPACEIRVISYNAGQGRTDVGATIAWILSQRPDLLIVIEASPSLEAQIGQKTGLVVSSGDGQLIASRAGSLSHQIGWHVRSLPGSSTSINSDTVEILPGVIVPVLAVHNSWPIPSRLARQRDLRVASVIQQVDRSRVIMAGDFNSTPWSFRHRTADRMIGVERRDAGQATWPASLPLKAAWKFPFPLLAIDHVYAGPAWRTISVRRGPRLGSDHYPLVTDLALRPIESLRADGAPASPCEHRR